MKPKPLLRRPSLVPLPLAPATESKRGRLTDATGPACGIQGRQAASGGCQEGENSSLLQRASDARRR